MSKSGERRPVAINYVMRQEFHNAGNESLHARFDGEGKFPVIRDGLTDREFPILAVETHNAP